MKQFKIFLPFALSLLFLLNNLFAAPYLHKETRLIKAGFFSEPGVLKGSFSGIITEQKTNAPLADVTVYFTDIKVGVSTKADGSFSISNIPEGRHLVEISHIGFTTIAEQVDVSGDTKRDYVLMKTAVENDAVVITGAGAATQLRKSPFQVALLKKEDFLQSSSTNIIEALAKQPGVSTLSTGPAISKPVIRGLSYNRVLTINDGVRQEGQQWGDEHGIEIDQASVSKVEILKGPASLIYGSDATAGVINIITNVPVENNTIKGNILSEYQSNNKERLLNANIAGNVNGFNWNLYGSTSAAADYRNKYDGYVFNSKFKQTNFGGYAGYNGSWGYSHLLFSNFNLKTGLTEGDRDAEGFFVKQVAGGGEVRATDNDFKSTTPLIPYQHIRHFKIATDNSFTVGKNRLSLNVGYQQNQREEFGNPDDVNERALYFDLKTITYTAQFHLQEMNGWKTSIGVNGMRQQNTNKGVEQLIPDYNLFDIGGYVYTQKTISKVTLSGGARYDTRNIDVKNLLDGSDIKGAAFTKTFSNFSGSAGMAAQVTKQLNVKLNIARGFRAPSIPELASNGAHEGTIRYEYGDNNLKSETSIQLDAGVEYNTEHVSVNLSAFYNSFDNFIFYKKLQTAAGSDSTVNVDGEALAAFKFDQRKAVLSGVEATVDIHPHPLDWLHFENTFSYTRGRFSEAIEGSKNLPFIPAARLISELRCNFPKLAKGIANFYAKVELDNTFAQDNIFTAYNTETATPGYSLLNAGIGADFISGKGRTLFTIHFAGSNLTDVAYQNHLSRLKYAAENLATGRIGVFNMGRNFSVKLTVPLTLQLKAK
jgi:iron complex outermembrane recepter protein